MADKISEKMSEKDSSERREQNNFEAKLKKLCSEQSERESI